MAKNMKVAAERDAADILKRYWRTGSLPVDPVAIARRLDVNVYSAQLGEDVSGMLIKNVDEDPAIYVDVDDSLPRQRFTVAHEIGHFVDRGIGASTMNYVDRRGGPFTLRELYANEFAGHLLMPAGAVVRLHEANWSAWELADHFGVSQEAIGIRLRRLNLT